MKLSFIQWIMISFMRVSTKIADDQNDAIPFGHRGASSCEKKQEKLLVPVMREGARRGSRG